MAIEDDAATASVLSARILQMAKLLLEHQAAIAALVAYVRAQPSYDAGEMGRLIREQREALGLPARPEPSADEVWRSLLEQFQGPIH